MKITQVLFIFGIIMFCGGMLLPGCSSARPEMPERVPSKTERFEITYKSTQVATMITVVDHKLNKEYIIFSRGDKIKILSTTDIKEN